MTRRLDIGAVTAFSEEVRASVPAILTALETLERDASDAAAAQEAFRLFHALKGAASMVGLCALGHLLNHAEELVEGAMTAERPFPRDLVAALRETTPHFAEYLDAALNGRPFDGLARNLLRAFCLLANRTEDDSTLGELLEIEQTELALHAEIPAPSVPACEADIEIVPAEPIPAELAEVFAQEAQEHLQTIARMTAHLGSAPDDRDALLELRRAVHTIKGAAGVVGYKGASRLAHRMEDLLDALADGAAVLTPEGTRVLLASSDALDDLITLSSDPAVLRDRFRKLLAEYDRLVSGATPTPAAAAVSEPAARTPRVPAADAPAAAAEATEPTASPAPAVRDPGPDRRRATRDRRQGPGDRRAGPQMVRVPMERLNELVRVVSELVLNRATFDQHYAALIDQVDELRLSTARLRRVTQKLETEYEVRAMSASFGPRPAPGSAQGFDALEFDRYTDFHLLTRELTETASDIGTVTSRLGETIGDFDGDITRLGRLTREVQDKAMEFRMVPLVTLAARLERAVRVTAQDCGKTVDLVLEGENVALDKSLLEEMADALVHLLRNAVDHGIESAAARAAAGKPARGRIVVRAYHEGTDAVIEVADDGRGLDGEGIRRTAVDRGYVTEADAAQMTLEELTALVFEPGFSTAAQVSEVSGRGVGLDAVRSTVARLGGRIRLSSDGGTGATVTVRVPMTLAITRVLLVRAGGQTLGLPLGAVLQIVRADAASIARVGADRVVNVDGRTYPLRDLAETLGLPHAADHGRQPVLIANLGGRHIAMAVDQIVQTRDAVVKTLGSHLRRVAGVWGATLLGDGTVVLILNPSDLASSAEEPRIRRPRNVAAAAARERDVRDVLIVDDSLSMRHVLSSLVKKAGWNALQARDGVEALEILESAARQPDLVLLDIEMPRMDGYEFLATVRGRPDRASLPIVMLTSRGGEKHREKAIGLGANGYVVKPFEEDALLQTMTGLMQTERHGRKAAS
jgi:chemosensory pili system protein ChpA (sensor histidine kinase/response regulator)